MALAAVGVEGEGACACVDGAVRAVENEIGPQVGFDEQREIRPPMVEEPGHEARRIERNELVHDTERQALSGERG